MKAWEKIALHDRKGLIFREARKRLMVIWGQGFHFYYGKTAVSLTNSNKYNYFLKIGMSIVKSVAENNLNH